MKILFAWTDHLEQRNQLGLFIQQKKQGNWWQKITYNPGDIPHPVWQNTSHTYRTSAYIFLWLWYWNKCVFLYNSQLCCYHLGKLLHISGLLGIFAPEFFCDWNWVITYDLSLNNRCQVSNWLVHLVAVRLPFTSCGVPVTGTAGIFPFL